jgi:hypothetical protein
MAISHVLKIMIRVERGDDEFLDTKGKRKVSHSFENSAGFSEIDGLSVHSAGTSSSRRQYISYRVVARRTFYQRTRLRQRPSRQEEDTLLDLRPPVLPPSSLELSETQQAVPALRLLTSIPAEEVPLQLITLHLKPQI